MRRFGALLLGLLAACRQGAPDGAAATASPSPPLSSGASADAHGTVDALDQRADLPLLPMMANHQKQNMRDHLLAVQEIVSALAADDFSNVEHAALRMGFSEPMARMCTHMGAAAPGFTERALEFHRTADTIAVAARRHDRSATVQALGATLGACTGCHAAFKQRVVDEATWNELARTAPASSAARTP